MCFNQYLQMLCSACVAAAIRIRITARLRLAPLGRPLEQFEVQGPGAAGQLPWQVLRMQVGEGGPGVPRVRCVAGRARAASLPACLVHVRVGTGLRLCSIACAEGVARVTCRPRVRA